MRLQFINNPNFTQFMKLRNHIPDFLTCLNLLCGCIALVYISHDELILASWMIYLAALFDFADGFAARSLKASSPIGKQLDSLADMVTFGLVPGYMLFQMLSRSNDIILLKYPWIPYVPFLITIFSALRLAKFNIDTRQKDGFIGMPTPASTIFISSFPFMANGPYSVMQWLSVNPGFILTCSLVIPFLLVSEIPMFTLKFKNAAWKKNEIQYLFLMVSCIMLLLWQLAALSIIIVLYVIASITVWMLNRPK
jgi:CDP-diacylglycerol---serine O-phosphatidyltransferase